MDSTGSEGETEMTTNYRHINGEKLDDLLNEAVVSTANACDGRPATDEDAYFLAYMLTALRDRFNLANVDDCLSTLDRLHAARVRREVEARFVPTA